MLVELLATGDREAEQSKCHGRSEKVPRFDRDYLSPSPVDRHSKAESDNAHQQVAKLRAVTVDGDNQHRHDESVQYAHLEGVDFDEVTEQGIHYIDDTDHLGLVRATALDGLTSAIEPSRAVQSGRSLIVSERQHTSVKHLARMDSLVAVPTDSGSDAYDVYSLRVNRDSLVLYEVFENIYEQGGIDHLVQRGTASAIESIIEAFPDDAISNYEPVALGVPVERFHTLDIDYAITRVLYVLKSEGFSAYATVWTGVDFDEFVAAETRGQRVLAFSKDATTYDRDTFIENLNNYGHAAAEITLDNSDVEPGRFVAALTAGARCVVEGADVWLRGLRVAVGETDDEWVVLQYRRASAGTSGDNGTLLRLPVSDSETFHDSLRKVVERSAVLRVRIARRLWYGDAAEDGIPPNPSAAVKMFERHLGNQFEALVPPFTHLTGADSDTSK